MKKQILFVILSGILFTSCANKPKQVNHSADVFFYTDKTNDYETVFNKAKQYDSLIMANIINYPTYSEYWFTDKNCYNAKDSSSKFWVYFDKAIDGTAMVDMSFTEAAIDLYNKNVTAIQKSMSLRGTINDSLCQCEIKTYTYNKQNIEVYKSNNPSIKDGPAHIRIYF